MASALFASVFSGAGGLDIGLEASGWSSVYASDIDRPAVETLSANRSSRSRVFADTHIEQADVRRLRGSEILSKASIRKGDLPLLVGGTSLTSGGCRSLDGRASSFGSARRGRSVRSRTG